MKRSILCSFALSAALLAVDSAEARNVRRAAGNRVTARRTVRTPVRQVTPVTRRPVIKKQIIRRPIVRKPIVRKPIVKKQILRRPIVKKQIVRKPLPVKKQVVLKHKRFVRGKGWLVKFGKNYHLRHGKKFHFGWCYHGHHHHHWTKCIFHTVYGCHCYFCGYTSCWYYWCKPHGCFYPVSYCPTGWYAY